MSSFDDIQTAVAKHLIFPDTRAEAGEGVLINPALRERLNRFAGFIGAVRHVQCRSSIPQTFEFLKKEGIYYTFFEFYEPLYQANRLSKRATPGDQLESLVGALKQFIAQEPASVDRKNLSYVLAHECTVLKIKQNHGKEAASDLSIEEEWRWNGDVVVKKLPPWFVTEWLNLHLLESSSTDDSTDEISVLYHRSLGSDAVRVMACDEDTAAIVALVDSAIANAAAGSHGLHESNTEDALVSEALAALSLVGLILKKEA
ncbi:MAG: hypothetical protein WA777_19030 [Rhodanobacter sp.]